MPYNPNTYHRRSTRLKEYDYSQAGAYFVTICCQDRASMFGNIADGEMILNDAGQMIETQWHELTNRFTNIELHEFIVMPNHFHGILQIIPVGATLVVAQNKMMGNDENESETGQPHIGQPQGIAPTGMGNKIGIYSNQQTNAVQSNQMLSTGIADKTVGDMLDAFKSITTVAYIRGIKNFGWQPFNAKLWQRNYHEHIIRDEQSYQTIASYIVNNPATWNDDIFCNLITP